MMSTSVLTRFTERLAAKDGRRAVAESQIRSAITGYARCAAIASGTRQMPTRSQLERAVQHYHKTRARITGQLTLLSA